MSGSRSAHHTIAGYLYQFDKSILEILRATRNTKITLEGIEDVDVEGKCIQCKYHSTQRYKRSLIKKPLVAFLKHYRDRGSKKRYILYAHFGDPSSFTPIDLRELKAILGDEAETLGLTDSRLRTFLQSRFIYERGDDIDGQRESVLSQLMTVLHAPRADCDQYYYNNALHEVFSLSRQPKTEDRTTTRAKFIRTIDNRRILFTRWLAEMKGQRDYCKHVRATLKASDALRANKKRFVFLEDEIVANESSTDIAVFCRTLADRHFELGKVLYDAVPVTVIIDRPIDAVREVQRKLLEWGISLNSGYEAIAFQPALFNDPPVTNRKGRPGGRVVDKVSRASYRISVISADTYSTHQAHIDTPDTFLIAGGQPSTNITAGNLSQVFRISDVESLGSLALILAK